MEPRRRRRPGAWLHEHLPGDEAGLVLTQLSLPTVVWVDWPAHGEPRPLWPLERLLDAIAGAGGTDVGLDHYTLTAYEDQGGSIDELRGRLSSRGLTCTDVCVLRLGETGAVERLARLADATGAPLCIAAADDATDHAAALAAAADVLAPAGVRLALEFAAYGGLTTLRAAVELCDAVGWERCGLLLDAWHFFRTGAPWADLRRLGDDRIALVHVSDGPAKAGPGRVRDSRFGRLLPGAGEFPLGALLNGVAARGYDGVVSAEVLSAELRARPPEDGARALVASLRALVADRDLVYVD